MWYGDDEQIQRAPTPQSVERRLNELEERDSIIFESIALPKKQRPNTTGRQAVASAPPMRIKSPSDDSMQSLDFDDDFDVDLEFSDDFFSSDFEDSKPKRPSPPTPDPTEMRKRLEQLERESQRLEIDIKNRELLIKGLRDRVQEMEKGRDEFKGRYEETKYELDSLKEALRAEGKMKVMKVKRTQQIHPPLN